MTSRHHTVAERAREKGFVLIGLYKPGKTKIRIKCLAHNEIHYADPGTILRGQGLKCCKIAKSKQAQRAKLIPGENDLATKFPEVAREAYGWDPSSTFPGSGEIKEWRCSKGHIFKSPVQKRTGKKQQSCSICSGREILVGFNDLQTTHPELAKEAYGWDPALTSRGSTDVKKWKCNLGHIYEASPNRRTNLSGRDSLVGCPYCGGKKVLKGFNDLLTHRLDVALEADGWDPSTVHHNSHLKLDWKCKLGHKWNAQVKSRVIGGRKQEGLGCPTCSNKVLLTGFNDTATRFPEIASEADGWDPALTLPGARGKFPWICKKGHKWVAALANRTSNQAGCPVCAETGFNPEKEAWMYLASRPGEQQFGISNVIKDRLRTHRSNGWTILEVIGPFDGQVVWDTEAALKKWLRNHIGLIKGSTENWNTTDFEVASLSELKKVSGIETDLF